MPRNQVGWTFIVRCSLVVFGCWCRRLIVVASLISFGACANYTSAIKCQLGNFVSAFETYMLIGFFTKDRWVVYTILIPKSKVNNHVIKLRFKDSMWR